ncbi:MAG: hypothetical protein NTX99_07820, partial [Candidatus Aminicenantes bacterium]|nr:hypothetical protein [Candidatus Aminicenantes bacterium]
ERDWNRYVTSHVCFEPRHMSREILFENYLRIRERYSAVPRIASRFLRSVPHGRPQALVVDLAVNVAFRRGARILRKKVKDGVNP